MYFRRLKIFFALTALAVLVEIGWLANIQWLRHDHFAAQAEQVMIRPPQFTPTKRGSILARDGQPLASNQRALCIVADYQALVEDRVYLQRAARKARSEGRFGPDQRLEDIADLIRQNNRRLLDDLPQLCGLEPDELQRNCRRAVEHVQRIKRNASQRSGRTIVVAEELSAHAIVEQIAEPVNSALIARLADAVGFALESTQQRVYSGGDAVAHLVGVQGPAVTADAVADGWTDPFADDPRRRYRAGEQRGARGIEHACESTLRGTRGLVQYNRDGQVIDQSDPVPGRDVRLTIDLELQRQVYEALSRHVQSVYQDNVADWGVSYGPASPCGGAVVVLNIGKRTVNRRRLDDGEILALVSYPGYDPNQWRRQFAQLRDDPREPMLFRAVSGVYHPGSTVKPAVLASAMQLGVVNPQGTINCPGWLISPTFPRFRCWDRPPLGDGHGDVTAPDSLKYSCNVYYYHLGQDMGMTVLSRWLNRFGLGRKQLDLLAEEHPGIVPDKLWYVANRPTMPVETPADARNAAIGQGDLAITPLASANMIATVARSGRYVQPTLIVGNPPPPSVDVGVDRRYWPIVHEGLVRVVNDADGTGRRARMETVRLAGKTGSASCSIRLLRADAVGMSAAPPGPEVAVAGRPELRRFPPRHDAAGKPIGPAHAWFVGYAPADRPAVAFACLVEYGIAGARGAGPLARDVVQLCINAGYVPGKSLRTE